MDWATSKAREEIEFDDSRGKEAKEERRRVLGNMGIAPQGEAEQQRGIRAQNETMKTYLETLRRQGGQRP